MNRPPTHMFFVNNATGTSYARRIAKNIPKSDAGCTCGGKLCGTKPTPKRGRRETDAELIAQWERFHAKAQQERGAARRASLGLASDIASILAERGVDVWGVRNILDGEPGTSVLDD